MKPYEEITEPLDLSHSVMNALLNVNFNIKVQFDKKERKVIFEAFDINKQMDFDKHFNFQFIKCLIDLRNLDTKIDTTSLITNERIDSKSSLVNFLNNLFIRDMNRPKSYCRRPASREYSCRKIIATSYGPLAVSFGTPAYNKIRINTWRA